MSLRFWKRARSPASSKTGPGRPPRRDIPAGQARLELQQAVHALLRADLVADKALHAAQVRAAIAVFMAADEPAAATPTEMRERFPAAAAGGVRLAALDDAALEGFNRLLPWAAMTMDERGRTIGSAWSADKRATPQPLSDRRLTAWDAEYPLAGKHVLELGCFEGLHTLALLALGARVTATDGRPENVLKTLARLWLHEGSAEVQLWDLEGPAPALVPEAWDALNHIGVLYHLSDPVGHLTEVLPRTREALLLDTHVARPEQAGDAYDAAGRSWPCFSFREKDVAVNPFAGLRDHARWLLEADLLKLLQQHGFGRVQVVSRRDERNGLRLTIRAYRS